ncbi:MAG: PilN domain-containing protein [Phycisphaeraceae bacterium]|nr:PilN domain-containing protein [Phycisphaeraceae bacterium]MBX3366692.1 PilN domain-containing protein [Phycisphaeraceae bacterium]
MINPFAQAKQPVAGGSFLPEDYISRKADGRANILCLFLFAVVMAGVVSAFLVTNRQWESVKAEHKAINTAYEQETKKIEQLKALETQRESMIERAEITTALIEKTPRSLLAAEVVQRMPEGITLLTADLRSKRIVQAPALESKAAEVRSVSGSSKAGSKAPAKTSSKSKTAKNTPPPAPRPQAPRLESTLILTGVAGANQEIADYLQALKQCDILESVELAYIKESVMSDLTLRKFQIDAKIRSGARIASAPQPTPTPGAPATAQPQNADQSAMTPVTNPADAAVAQAGKEE